MCLYVVFGHAEVGMKGRRGGEEGLALCANMGSDFNRPYLENGKIKHKWEIIY